MSDPEPLFRRGGNAGRRPRLAGHHAIRCDSSRQLVDPVRDPHRMKERLATARGRARYARRKWLSEAPNGWIKEVLGFRCFSFRGLEKVRAEWDLVCLAVNIKRIGALASVS